MWKYGRETSREGEIAEKPTRHPANTIEPTPTIERPRVFKSRAHPEGSSAPLVFGAAVVRPLALGMLPLMVVTLVAVLEGDPVVPYLVWGFPAVLLLATLWTGFRLRRTVAEVHVAAESAALRTVWECLQEKTPPQEPPQDWKPVVDLRKGRSSFSLALGDTVYELDDADWPELPALLRALQRARHTFAPTSSHAPSTDP